MNKLKKLLVGGLFLILFSFGKESRAQIVSTWNTFDANLHDGADVESFLTHQIGVYVGSNCHAYSFWLAYGRPLPSGPQTSIWMTEAEVHKLISNHQLKELSISEKNKATHVLYYRNSDNALVHSAIVSQFDCLPYKNGGDYVQGRNGFSPLATIHKVNDYGSGVVTPKYFQFTPWHGNLIPLLIQPNCPWDPFKCEAVKDNPVTCIDGEDGVVSVVNSASPGATTRHYLWSNGATTNTVNNLSAGIYTVSIIEVPTGLTCQSMVTLYDPFSIVNHIATTDMDDNGYCIVTPWGDLWGGGTATVVLDNPAGSYSYLWDNRARNQTTQTAISLCYGDYTVWVTDNVTGCTEELEFTITGGSIYGYKNSGTTTSVEGAKYNVNDFNIYPNPNSGVFNISIENNGKISSVEVFDMMGKQVFKSATNEAVQKINISDQPKGIYLVKLTVGNDVLHKKVIYQ